MKLAIVGYRKYTNYVDFKRNINKNYNYEDLEVIVTGDAWGADSMAKRYAKEYNIPCIIHVAYWDIFGKYAGPRRNQKIVDDSEEMIAFLHPKSKGTKNAINRMNEAGKQVITILLNPSPSQSK